MSNIKPRNSTCSVKPSVCNVLQMNVRPRFSLHQDAVSITNREG